MRTFTRRHFGLATTILLGVAGLIGGLAVFVPDLREWFGHNPVLGWIAALIGWTVAIQAWISWDRAVETSERAAKDHSDALEQARREHADSLASKDAAIDSLNARLHPSKRDLDQFAELLERFPWDRGTIPWLDGGFNAKQWTDLDVTHLYHVADSWAERYFDGAEVQHAFARFREAVNQLVQWLSYEGASVPEANKSLTGGRMVYRIAGPDRDGGYQEVDRVRREAFALAANVLEERRNIESVGRARGL